MNFTQRPKNAATIFLFLAAILPLSADVVITTNGSRLVGSIKKIDAGSVYMDSDYAALVIKQKDVVSIETDHPRTVRLASGTQIVGVITTTPQGTLQVTGTDATVSTAVSKVAACWLPDQLDPEVAALQRHWKYEATVDINGTSGNKNQLGTGAAFSAKLVTPQDSLLFYSAYDRQVADSQVAADQFKGGIDYTANLDPRLSWFVRDEAGFDRVMGIRFYETAAAGFGYSLIKNDYDTLTARVGLGYRYDGYTSPAISQLSAVVADFELEHDLKLKNWELGNKLAIMPSLQGSSNLGATQDSFFQIPLANPAWKLRSGVSNIYEGQVAPGFKRLDTTYYTRLILDWGQ